MREELARLIHPVVVQALKLRDQLLRAESPSLATEQDRLITLLQDEQEAQRVPDFGGAPPDTPSRSGGGGGGALLLGRGGASEAAPPPSAFLGLRYALVCWLDELFILHSPWSEVWNEHKLEVRLYESNDRAWRFWDQARVAADRTSTDALEGFYSCVMLGFTGELADSPDRLVQWVQTTRNRLVRARTSQWHSPPEREPGTHVPPLLGRRRLRRALLVVSGVLVALIPVVAFLLAWKLG